MMKKFYWTGAAFAVACAGAVGVSAGTTVNLKGSDTLFDFTNAMISACPGAVGPYAGTGSGNGQAAMATGAQQIAPMSRFLNTGNNLCALGGFLSPDHAEGLVVGLDGLSIVGSRRTFGSTNCNGNANVTCDPNFQPTTGTAFNTTVAGYAFNGWRDVLRVLLAGFDHNNTGTGAANWATRDCNSPIRQAIANNYGAFFENNCTAPAGETATTVCTQIRHIFRRDDFSGTTDTVVSLLNLPAIVLPETSVTLNVNGTASTIVQHTGATPFCNAVRPAFVYPASPTQPSCLQGSDATYDPTQRWTTLTGGVPSFVPIAPPAGLPACAKETAVYRASMQDNDPIRRPCAAAEQVCSHSKDLGLVLTMNDVTEDSPRSNADRYNISTCGAGAFASATAPEVFDAITQRRVICALGLLCPNSDQCTSTGACVVPRTAGGSAQCLAIVTNAQTTCAISPSNLLPVAHPQGCGIQEGRAYNQHLYVQVGAGAAYQTNGFSTPLPLTGAYYRIHATRSLNPDTNRTCQFADMTDQIGCLVEASPCSIGYAGRGALSTNPNVAGIKLNKQSPETACIQSSFFIYPFARKLYVNSVQGFAAVNGQELQLAGCMTDLAQPGLSPPTPAGLVTSNIVAAGFLPIPLFVNNGTPFCEDFNEGILCNAPSDINACANPHDNFDTFPGFTTVCGDGQIDSFEDCDNGTLNGPPPATCSAICRFNN
jgi:hypothetical protein